MQNFSNFTLRDTFNFSILNYTNSSLIPDNISTGEGEINWTINLSANSSTTIEINFTSLLNQSATNLAQLFNSTGSQVVNSSQVININNQPANTPPSIFAAYIGNQPFYIGDILQINVTLSNPSLINRSNLSVRMSIDSDAFEYLNATLQPSTTTSSLIEWTNISLAATSTTNIIVNLSVERTGQQEIITSLRNSSGQIGNESTRLNIEFNSSNPFDLILDLEFYNGSSVSFTNVSITVTETGMSSTNITIYSNTTITNGTVIVRNITVPDSAQATLSIYSYTDGTYTRINGIGPLLPSFDGFLLQGSINIPNRIPKSSNITKHYSLQLNKRKHSIRIRHHRLRIRFSCTL